MDMNMIVKRETLRAAVASKIFCEKCGVAPDYRKAAIVDVRRTAGAKVALVVCGKCLDTMDASIAKLRNMYPDAEITIIDGRTLGKVKDRYAESPAHTVITVEWQGQQWDDATAPWISYTRSVDDPLSAIQLMSCIAHYENMRPVSWSANLPAEAEYIRQALTRYPYMTGWREAPTDNPTTDL